MKRQYTPIIALFGVVLTTGYSTALAEQFNLNGPAKISTSAKSYGPDTLTPDQIRSCLSTGEQLEFQNKILTSQSKGFEKKRAAIDALETKIEASQAYLDKHTTKEVNDDAGIAARNRKIEDHNALITDYNNRITAYEKQAAGYAATNERYTEQRKAFYEQCSDKQYYVEDLKAVQAEE